MRPSLLQFQMMLAAASGSAIAQSIYNKIVGWWELDEISGTTVYDSHVNGLHGTSSGVSVNQTGLASNLDKSYAFPSGNNYISIPNNSLLNIKGALSIMAWVKRNGTQGNYPKLLWKTGINDAAGRGNYMFQQDNVSLGGKLVFRLTFGGVNFDLAYSSAMADATAYQYVATRKLNTAKIFENGSQINSNTSLSSGDLDTGTGPLRIGYVAGTGDNWIGNSDQFAVFNDELTAAEVAYLYNSGAGMSYAALAALAGH